MKNYLAEIFGIQVKLEKWDGISRLPLYLRNKREYFMLSFEKVQLVLMKNNSNQFHISNFEKELQEIEKFTGISVVLWLDAVSTYQRNALIKNRISFIVPYSQIYVPELGMCLKEFCAGKREKAEKLSATAQFLLLYFIYRKEQTEIGQSELAESLNMSAMNVSRAVQELQEQELLLVRKEGTSKMVKAVSNGKELYQLSSPHLQSPVQKKIYVSQKLFDMELPLAGETALAKQSMLNYPKCTVYALDKKCAGEIPREHMVKPEFLTGNNYVEIELWKYDPKAYAVDGMVDMISLIQSLKEVEDERVEIQIEEIMEEYKWS